MAHQEHHDHGDDHAEAHDDHHEPPPPEEPQTPLWFTLFGAALFVMGGIAFLVVTAEPAPEGAKKEAPARATAQPPPPPPTPTAAAMPRPALSGLPALRRMAEEKK